MIPRATVRLQFNRDFTFDKAVEVLPYLAALGVSHVYASPILGSTPGSTHGYDVTDPLEIDPELGGYAGLLRLSGALRRHDMGLILDIVPNHMAASPDNPWWFDVLQWGRASPRAAFFDLNWEDRDPEVRGKVFLPVLGDGLEACLERGELRIEADEERGIFLVCYFDDRYPLDPRSYDMIFEADGQNWDGLAKGFRQLRDAFDPGFAKKLCTDLADWLRVARPADRGGLLQPFDPSSSSGRERLARLLAVQNYVLAYWREAGRRINWRRFFDINQLVALRMDRPEVFEACHRLIFTLVRDGIADGLRVDHVDGLADPEAYCRKVRERLQEIDGTGRHYLIVEKILEPDEQLSDRWPIDGTTGYDFMDQVSAVLHDPGGETALTALWQEASGDSRSFGELARDARREIVQRLFPRQLHRLLVRLSDGPTVLPSPQDKAMVELLASLRRYRLYGTDEGFPKGDLAVLDEARRQASTRLEGEERVALDGLCAKLAAPDSGEARQRFQQLSATLAAKAVEDTSFYRYHRLFSRNEVGSDPGRIAISPGVFHAAAKRRRVAFPAAMLATATHDHKRGEDNRARLAVLSESADEWAARVRGWFARYSEPARSIQLAVYQSLIGAWPLQFDRSHADERNALRERLDGWLVKALREAKQQTSWSDPDESFERASQDFLGRLFASEEFLAEAEAFVTRIAAAGAVNGLVQTLLRLTVPGVPDLYQGTELWDLSLVDPDNRRPVDFGAREAALGEAADLAALLADWRDGRIKQALIAALLRFRRLRPLLFAEGSYEPLAVSGAREGHLLAFARVMEDEALIIAIPRCVLGAVAADSPTIPPEFWADTSLAPPQRLLSRLATDLLCPRAFPVESAMPVSRLFDRVPLSALHIYPA